MTKALVDSVIGVVEEEDSTRAIITVDDLKSRRVKITVSWQTPLTHRLSSALVLVSLEAFEVLIL
jgi:hypothetical protein